MCKTKKKDLTKENKFNKKKTSIKQNQAANIFEFINDSIFCMLISIIVFNLSSIIEDLMFVKIYIIFKLLNLVFCLKIFTKYTKIKKFLSLLMLYDNFIKIIYLF
ncbi:hypothetical protein TUBRATIS_20690 [Tubulinosema ratisbonensis]|uniref:Uncharacterized protein n=1 Tax=Tubulinosema ratisbonensis TaxID=291195 RepID=A0A437AK35_9MICR|nr:hypothetical protein TUBRATIS_20690 [Tubulinosema ratisbonensis]